MHQLAWLDFYGDKWHLATCIRGNLVRQWIDRETALADLAGEGWIIIGPYPKQQVPDIYSKSAFHGFTLVRTVN
jgi:hypothetical protein